MSHPLDRFLNRIEWLGNRIPHPALLFIYLALGVLLLSAFLGYFGINATHPISGEKIEVVNLLSRTGLHLILTKTVSNFTQFAPVGPVLVAMLGIGIAEQSGLLSALMRGLVNLAPARALTVFVALAGVLSSLAADSGYVVLIPLAAVLFATTGRSPLAGIATAFAGVSAGYSANLAIGPLDAMLAGISTEAVHLVDPTVDVGVAANYYFMAASTLFVTLLITWVTERFTVRRLTTHSIETTSSSHQLSREEQRGLRIVGLGSAVFTGLLLAGLVPEQGLLRTDQGSILNGPFIQGIVTLIALFFGIAGCAFGFTTGKFTNSRQAIESMEGAMKTMASYLVLMFFAAQFVSYFSWTNLGLISAIKGADLLQSIKPDSSVLLVLFVLLAATINLLIGSASAKWAVMAPVFVPLLMLYGIDPAATQAAYRVGDSSSNIITPLMPYFGIVVVFAQRYDPRAGIGTLAALMLPYSAALLIGWSTLLALWLAIGWPLGPG